MPLRLREDTLNDTDRVALAAQVSRTHVGELALSVILVVLGIAMAIAAFWIIKSQVLLAMGMLLGGVVLGVLAVFKAVIPLWTAMESRKSAAMRRAAVCRGVVSVIEGDTDRAWLVSPIDDDSAGVLLECDGEYLYLNGSDLVDEAGDLPHVAGHFQIRLLTEGTDRFIVALAIGEERVAVVDNETELEALPRWLYEQWIRDRCVPISANRLPKQWSRLVRN